MGDLASNLFLREMAKRDLDQQQKRQDDVAATNAYSQMIDQSENSRDKEFQRHLSVAKLAGEQASKLGEDRPSFKGGAIDEQAGLGFGAGEVDKKEAEEKASQARAMKELTAKSEMDKEKYKEGQSMDRLGLQLGSNADIAKGNQDAAYQRALLKLKGQRETNANELTKGAAGKQQTASIDAQGKLNAIRNLKLSAKVGEQDGKHVVDYESLLGPTAKNRLLVYEAKVGMSGEGALTPSERKDYERHKAFRARTGLLKTELKKKYFGTAMTEAEQENAVNAIINEDMNPQEFEAALGSLEQSERTNKDTADVALNRPANQWDDEFVNTNPAEGGEPGVGGAAGSIYSKGRNALGALPWLGDFMKKITPPR